MSLARIAALSFIALFTIRADATVGFSETPASGSDGSVSVFYPSAGPEHAESFGAFRVKLAIDAPPAETNQRLIVISPGSGAPPWVYFDLAAELVGQGFVVVMPRHRGDNDRDGRATGPASWKQRPAEVSRVIDRLGGDSRFRHSLDLSKVGMYGMSAGGHTALVLAGGRWSPHRLKEHCDRHIAEDFHACAGLDSRLTGGLLDRFRRLAVKWINDLKFSDRTWYQHTDPRITAIVAGVPFAADFDPESLRSPTVALGIISARMDRWLVPRYHADAVVQACSRCELIDDIRSGGHGALLSPLPPERHGLLAELIDDPSGFDRAVEIPRINREIAAYFTKTLLEHAPR